MIYQVEQAYMDKRKALKLTNRDLANALNLKPSTLASKLSGYAPFWKEERRALEEFFEMKEKENTLTVGA